MALIKIEDYNPNYEDSILHGHRLNSFDLYTSADGNRVGSVRDILVDESGKIRYFIIDTGFWIFGKKVLLPIGLCRIDYTKGRVYASNLTEARVKELPRYDEDTTVDYTYEEKVRNIYPVPERRYAANQHDESSYDHDDHDRDLFGVREEDHGILKLYEERLIADKNRQKVGEVAVGKSIETQQAEASVPVENERVVIDRRTPTDPQEPVPSHETDFSNEEVARLEIHEETANIEKEAFVSEEVSVKKEVDRDVVTAQEKLRREKLDLDVEGRPTVEHNR
ncbi:hypothetical protein cce_4648 [Crocosphaera subtropica ATCC 51142]|uniref:PRC-barrel domain-containing protein n=1 Tax=Crocosphaera subtropica (strain ATCC 51142 / BH68) TaxID=43989 RepID=B1WW68_CROS5|nr:DUF2382 domain-containing protein [Crocosphaera subtropica]ACB53996.1 hypothetical protein cce_4648 [Crocosphaera subtropica ATCC 51142]